MQRPDRETLFPTLWFVSLGCAWVVYAIYQEWLARGASLPLPVAIWLRLFALVLATATIGASLYAGRGLQALTSAPAFWSTLCGLACGAAALCLRWFASAHPRWALLAAIPLFLAGGIYTGEHLEERRSKKTR